MIPDGVPDLEVLRIAADSERALVTADIRTMRTHFEVFLKEQDSPGVIQIPSSRSIGDAIEGLLAAWLTWSLGDLRNQLWWLP